MNTKPLEEYDNPPIGITLEELLEVLNESKFVIEHYVNLTKKEDMEKYKDEVFQLLVDGYKNSGGLIGMDSADQLVAETDFWKLCRRHGKITAAFCYTTKRGGRKTCYGSCQMTTQGKRDFLKIMYEDMVELGRKVWAEISGPIEHIYLKKMGATIIPAEIAQIILRDKKFEKIDPDGCHYWRKIGGELKRKIMVGVYDDSMLNKDGVVK